MSTATDPLSQLVKDAVITALNESGKPLRNRLMDTSLAAEYLGVGVDTVKRLHAAGEIPSVRLAGKKLLFDVNDLDAAIEQRKEFR